MSSKKMAAFNEKIQQMFQQVNNAINHMLNSLTYIYQAHGIKYKVADKFQFLVRLLTPFEILSYFHISDIQGLLDRTSENFWSFRDHFRFKNQLTNQQKNNITSALNVVPSSGVDSISQKIKAHGGYRYGNLKNYLLKQHQKRKKIQSQTLIKEPESLQIDKQGQDNMSKKNLVSRPHLSEAQQNKICDWIKSMAREGKVISKTDVIHQAKILSNAAIGSTGWGRGFFSRHKQLLKYIKRAKPTQRQKLSFMYSEDIPSSQEEIQSMEQNQSFSNFSNRNNEQKSFNKQFSQNYVEANKHKNGLNNDLRNQLSQNQDENDLYEQ